MLNESHQWLVAIALLVNENITTELLQDRNSQVKKKRPSNRTHTTFRMCV
jgi:hypothetical protein